MSREPYYVQERLGGDLCPKLFISLHSSLPWVSPAVQLHCLHCKGPAWERQIRPSSFRRTSSNSISSEWRRQDGWAQGMQLQRGCVVPQRPPAPRQHRWHSTCDGLGNHNLKQPKHHILAELRKGTQELAVKLEERRSSEDLSLAYLLSLESRRGREENSKQKVSMGFIPLSSHYSCG